VALVRETPSAGLSNRICWMGGITGFDRVVAAACEHAVALAPEIGDYRDSRGVIHALAGDYEAAIDDFRVFVAWGAGKRDPDILATRSRWIELLEQRVNPFDAETLDALISEVQ